jgi:hypothetical protein
MDNQITLEKGKFTLRVRDASNNLLSVSVQPTVAGTPVTESPTFKRISGASIYQLAYSPETDLLLHVRFSGNVRQTLDRYDYPPALPDGSVTATPLHLQDPLPVTQL